MKTLRNHVRSSLVFILLLVLSSAFAQKPKKSKIQHPRAGEVSTTNQKVAKDTDVNSIAKPVALLIGNDRYPAPNNLIAPGFNVFVISHQLKEKGYAVTVSENDNLVKTKKKIAKFAASARKAPISFFYYAGHTLTFNNKNYLVPIDAKLLSEKAIPAETIDLDWIVQKLDSTRTNILTIDGCYSSLFPFELSKSSSETCYATPSNLPGSITIAFTTAQIVEKAKKKKGKTSLFSRTFIKELNQTNIYNTFYDTKIKMMTKSQGKQNLVVYGNLNDNMGWMGIPTMMQSQFNMPNFPWPPPEPSAKVTWDILTPAFEQCSNLEEVNNILVSALHSQGYTDKSYFEISENGNNHGFVIATRLEQINEDATSKEDPNRWNPYLIKDTAFSWKNIMKSLFYSDKGYFRIIVFVITDLNIPKPDKSVNREQASKWIRDGSDGLHKDIAKKSKQDFKVTALIYEYKLQQNRVEAKLEDPSLKTGVMHLTRSQIGLKLKID